MNKKQKNVVFRSVWTMVCPRKWSLFYSFFLLVGLFLAGCVNDEPGPNDLFLANNIPIADAGPDQNVANGALVRLDGSNSRDPDGDVINFRWRVLSSPQGSLADLNGSETPTPTFIADVDGIYRIELVVVEEPDVDIQNQDPDTVGGIPAVAQGESSDPDEVTILVGPPGAFEGSGNKFILDGEHFGRSTVSMEIGGNVALTAEGWFFIVSLPNASADAFLMGKQGVFDIVVGSDLMVRGRLYPSSGAPVTLTSSNPITLQTWHHVALMIDRTNNDAYIALDGKISNILVPPTALAQNVNRFSVGSPDGKNLWVGLADEIRVTQDLRYLPSDFAPPLELLIPDSPFIDGARNTVHALYHFDEPSGAFLYLDFSLRVNNLFRIALTGFQPFGRMLKPRQFHTATDSGVSGTEALVVWDTDEPATSRVDFGETTAYTETPVLDSTRVTRHIVRLSGLTPSTTYHYKVTSTDIAGNTVDSGTVDHTFNTSDSTAPVLSAVGVSGTPGSTSATIIWTSNEPATSLVQYGETSSYGSASLLNSTPVTSHSVSLTGLTPDTTYNYRVISADPSGNIVFSANLSFPTAVGPDVTSPQISKISSGSAPQTTSGVITWVTDEAATSQVDYGLNSSYGSTASDLSLVTRHSVTLTGLTAETLYHYQVSSADGAGNTAVSTDLTFTPSATDNIPPNLSGINAFNDNRIWIAGGLDSGGNAIVESEMIGINGELSSDRLLSVVLNASVLREVVGQGTGIETDFAFSLQSTNLEAGSLRVTAGSVVAVDDGNGVMTGSGIISGSVDYEAGNVGLTYTSPPGSGLSIEASYDYHPGTSGIFNHTATRLADGRVLITGGEDDQRKPRSEVFLMTPGNSTLAPLFLGLNTPRRFHTATVMADGSVQIALGEELASDGKPKTLNSIEVLVPDDTLSDTFRLGTPLSHVPSKLHKAIIPKSCDAALPSETLLFVGGYNGSNVPGQGSPPLQSGRIRHALACLPDGKILVTGGISASGTILDTVERYDPSTNTYTALNIRMNVPRADHTATLLPDQTVLITGGYNQVGQALQTAEIYDPVQNRFTLVESLMSQGRFGHLARLWTDLSTGNKGVLLIGGADNGGAPIALLEIYFP